MKNTDMMLEVRLANELGDNIRDRMSEIFVDGFYQWLNYFSKDKNILKNTFRHMFNPGAFYVCLYNDEVVGMTGCADPKNPSVILKRSEFVKHLGFIRGRIAYHILKKEFEIKEYPIPVEEDMGAIEFVAVDKDHRRLGIAESMIKSIIDSASYNAFLLEVADTNTNAWQLYTKLGFTEVMRVKEKHSEQSGVNYLIYMKYEK